MEGDSSWSSWIQNIAGGVISKAAEAKWVQPYDIEKLRLQQLGQAGYYAEGQRVMPATAAAAGTIGGFPTKTLLIGGVGLVLVLALVSRRR